MRFSVFTRLTWASLRLPNAACYCLHACWLQGIYLVADDADAADAWVDALVLAGHLAGCRCGEALEEALAPTPARRKQSAALGM